MGDLQCASQHLKSVQHSEAYAKHLLQFPDFEASFTADRQKSLDSAVENVLTRNEVPALEQIPLKFGNVTPVVAVGKEKDVEKDVEKVMQAIQSSKKKKKKTDEDKKDKKRKKKKKRGSSSSSSSSSSDSDSSSSSSSSCKQF